MRGSPFYTLVAKSAQTGLAAIAGSSVRRVADASLHRAVVGAALLAMRCAHRLMAGLGNLAKIHASRDPFAWPARPGPVSTPPSIKREDIRI